MGLPLKILLLVPKPTGKLLAPSQLPTQFPPLAWRFITLSILLTNTRSYTYYTDTNSHLSSAISSWYQKLLSDIIPIPISWIFHTNANIMNISYQYQYHGYFIPIPIPKIQIDTDFLSSGKELSYLCLSVCRLVKSKPNQTKYFKKL